VEPNVNDTRGSVLTDPLVSFLILMSNFIIIGDGRIKFRSSILMVKSQFIKRTSIC